MNVFNNLKVYDSRIKPKREPVLEPVEEPESWGKALIGCALAIIGLVGFPVFIYMIGNFIHHFGFLSSVVMIIGGGYILWCGLIGIISLILLFWCGIRNLRR